MCLFKEKFLQHECIIFFYSYRCFIRKKLIEKGIVEWLVKYLEQLNPNWSNQSINENSLFNADNITNDKDQASCYGLEYSTALFMNLCLHKSGKEKCLPMAKLVLQIFAHLLNTQVKQVIAKQVTPQGNWELVIV